MATRAVVKIGWDLLPDNPTLLSMLVGLLVLGACIVGIHSQVLFSLASIWPANAMLLAILVLKPETNRPLTWLVSSLAFIGADLLAGNDLARSTLLNGANIAGVAGGALVFKSMPKGVLLMQRPTDAIFIVVTIVFSATCAAVAGIVPGTMLFAMSVTDSFYLWFSTELVNYSIVLALAFGIAMPKHHSTLSDDRFRVLSMIAAVVGLLGSIGLMHLLGRAGSIAFSVPALIWCAVIFPPMVSMLLTALTCGWLLIAAPLNLLPLHTDLAESASLSSLRLGVAMVAIAPFAVACLTAAWNTAQARLEFAAEHDALTGLFNRGAFVERAARLLTSGARNGACMLMLDVDHFKQINDTHGHAMGDDVLGAIGVLLRRALREDDLIGRIGGEEFAVLLPGTSILAATIIAERIRRAMATCQVPCQSGQPVPVTVSIGLAHGVAGTPLGTLMSAADTALYRAKRGGRDRVELAGQDVPEIPLSARTR
ncbi:GGDEF domain-containing protein [Devosia sp. A449]